MANKVSNPYIELFEQLPVPERLEPENIAAMLKERAALGAAPEKLEKIKPAKAEKPAAERNITVSSSKRKTTVAYRSIASIAACAALALGIVGYLNVGNSEIPSEVVPDSGDYASDYGDVHKKFEKFYIDNADRTTLDSAIEDIERSYNDAQNESSVGGQINDDDPIVTADDKNDEVIPPIADDNPPPASEPDDEPLPPVENTETVDDGLPLPENEAESDNSDIAFGEGFILIRDSNMIRVINNFNGALTYSDNIFPQFEEMTTKTLAGFYADGTKAVAVYSVVYGDSSSNRSAVEVCVYDIFDGKAQQLSVTVQDGSLIDMNFANGALYLVTVYNDYRVAPIIGVEDLESYVPSYTLNGVKCYVQPSDIMIPDYLTTTDYTVISGIRTDGAVSVKAVLGYEGRVLVRNGAVYLFGYDDDAGSAGKTYVRVFSLSGGNVLYAGRADIDGIALGGDGISTFGSAIAVATVKNPEDGYVTVLGVYDGTMNPISMTKIPGALTTAKRSGDCIYFTEAKESCGIDLSDPAKPAIVESAPAKDPAKGLVEFNGGYVTLTKAADGSLQLAKLIKNEAGTLELIGKTVISTESGVVSKALENNGLLLISGDIVGLPYGYYDGLDYCYRYALYRETDGSFAEIGSIECHETDPIFENEKAILNNGVLYIFSKGRVYSTVVGSSLSVVSKADIVESSYSGH